MSTELTGVTNVGSELQNLSLTAHMPRDDERNGPISDDAVRGLRRFPDGDVVAEVHASGL